tara:strand:- start:2552 stop:2887 length:336 start_codon:yes stop_codon:yes gene_type:complete
VQAMRQHGAHTTERQDTNNQLVLDLDVVVGLDHSIELMEIGVVTRVQWAVVHHAFLSVWCDDPKATTCVPRDGYAIEARLVREVVVREKLHIRQLRAANDQEVDAGHRSGV